VARHRQRNDRRDAGAEWLWGWHTVTAALDNPAREPPARMVATPEKARQILERYGAGQAVELAPAGVIAQLTGAGAGHQGVALRAPPLAPAALEEIAAPAKGVIVVLDQLTDPRNVGAVFRSAAAFGVRGIVLQDRHAPALAGALAKAAAGAVDKVAHVRVVNLSRALEQLTDLGWRAVGLDGEAPGELAAVLDERPTALVLGSEGEGLRRLVREHCDVLARIPMPGGFASLNVSAAAAIALYEASRRQ
jgi:23S rRNA (guanosine2251-2'-O)-methyltransferase